MNNNNTTTNNETDLRKSLETAYGRLWNTEELQKDYSVQGFCMGIVFVRRKSDNKLGSLQFTHMPRYYYNFVED